MQAEEDNTARRVFPGYDIEQLTATEFAKFVIEFYKALLALGIAEEFAQRLTQEFVRKP